MRTLIRSLLPFALIAVAVPAHAQRFGLQASWGEDSDMGVGARLEFPLGLQGEGRVGESYLIASFDYFFPGCGGGSTIDCRYFEGNAGIAIPFNLTGMNPYVGAGLNVARASVDLNQEGTSSVSDTDYGLNVLGGVRFPLSSLSMFGEGRWELSGGRQFVLSVGFLFGGGGS